MDEPLKPVVKSVDMKDDMRAYAEKVRTNPPLPS